MGGVVGGGGGGHFVEFKSTYLDTATMRDEESQEIEGDDTGGCGLSVCFLCVKDTRHNISSTFFFFSSFCFADQSIRRGGGGHSERNGSPSSLLIQGDDDHEKWAPLVVCKAIVLSFTLARFFSTWNLLLLLLSFRQTHLTRRHD